MQATNPETIYSALLLRGGREEGKRTRKGRK